MEQKKNLEESGLPAESVAETTTAGADEVITEESLKSMSYDDLIGLLTSNGIPAPVDAANKEDLLTWMLAEFGV